MVFIFEIAFEEPPLNRCKRRRAFDRNLPRSISRRVGSGLGESTHCQVLEYLLRRDYDPAFAGHRRCLKTEYRIAAKLKEVVIRPNAGNTQ